jgi:transaldolase
MLEVTQLLHDLGQSIWLDNITRDLLNSGTLKRYATELSVTGLTSNPTIFDHAIKNSSACDFAKSGVDVVALAAQLQDEGAKSFVKSWNELMAVIASKSTVLKGAAAG